MSTEHGNAPDVPSAYDLTDFVGRRKNDERVVVLSRNHELNLFTGYVLMGSAIASVPFTAFACMVIAMFSPSLAFVGGLITPIFILGGMVFIDQRSKQGLRLRNYRAFLDRRSASRESNTVYIAGEPVTEPEVSFNVPRRPTRVAVKQLHAPAVGARSALTPAVGKVSILDA